MRRVAVGFLGLVLVSGVAWAKGNSKAAEAFTAYVDAVKKASSASDLESYLSSGLKKERAATLAKIKAEKDPATREQKLDEFNNSYLQVQNYDPTDIKVIDEQASKSKSELLLEAQVKSANSGDGRELYTVSVVMVQEQGKWKVDKESWESATSSSDPSNGEVQIETVDAGPPGAAASDGTPSTPDSSGTPTPTPSPTPTPIPAPTPAPTPAPSTGK
jgi:hypothetical protein